MEQINIDLTVQSKSPHTWLNIITNASSFHKRFAYSCQWIVLSKHMVKYENHLEHVIYTITHESTKYMFGITQCWMCNSKTDLGI